MKNSRIKDLNKKIADKIVEITTIENEYLLTKEKLNNELNRLNSEKTYLQTVPKVQYLNNCTKHLYMVNNTIQKFISFHVNGTNTNKSKKDHVILCITISPTGEIRISDYSYFNNYVYVNKQFFFKKYNKTKSIKAWGKMNEAFDYAIEKIKENYVAFPVNTWDNQSNIKTFKFISELLKVKLEKEIDSFQKSLKVGN